ncbi:hemerythrin domain-containing protein [Methylobacterium nodulans]|uniref:Hemerythrin-like domain-containing protein n=1 Tax=Methylobacterium nodulans (strain LMG 21967 / CNCM I-2342 / ORS 2060) TaxID=460265 RepID=B8IG95_METNO|nr:hemerythrin domain-containing protein [Methylobacterium nodulans]ACL61572.1 conserved hypothetical protein [Methylobacterium nodulans ORS 2060]
MDVWQLIARDHANITDLIREIPYALNGPGVVRSREQLLADLIDELDAHAEAIDASLLEPLSAHNRASGLISDLRREDHQVMQQLDQLAAYRGKGSQGWLNTFEDVTYLVDQHLSRHTNELLPLAREVLSSEQVQNATSTFIRAKMRALQSGTRSRPQTAAGGGLFGAVAVLAAVALGLIALRSAL